MHFSLRGCCSLSLMLSSYVPQRCGNLRKRNFASSFNHSIERTPVQLTGAFDATVELVLCFKPQAPVSTCRDIDIARTAANCGKTRTQAQRARGSRIFRGCFRTSDPLSFLGSSLAACGMRQWHRRPPQSDVTVIPTCRQCKVRIKVLRSPVRDC